MIGFRLGPYEITAKLGEGGMGEVYRATDTKLKRDVAIKVLPAGFTEDKERLARFEREAQLLAQLHHPNIASIFGLEESDGTRALVMELVEGPTLAERLEHGALPFNESLSVSLQIAQALEEAHEKGIVHRDLKPQNIKASIEGKVKVLDFGLAKAMDPAGGGMAVSPHDLAHSPTVTFDGTREGVILGTAAYMAPEQARGGAVDKRADIWAFGVVLWEMLTGERLFAEGSLVDTLSAVMRKEIDLAKLPATVPPRVHELVRRCLERNPKNRLHDIADARVVLEEVERGLRGPAPAGTSTPREPERAGWRLGATVGAALALAVFAYLVMSGGRSGPRADSRTAPPATPAPQAAPDRSIAVLPFENLSAEAENAFFAAGVHEDVLTYLSRVSELRVISRSSVLQYAQRESSVKKIAGELGVSYVVEGSVRRAENRVRVTAQLIDARTDEHVWADNFDRDLADVFAIQSAIAQEIVAALKASLTPREAELLTSRPTKSIEAYDLFVKARGLIAQQGATSSEEEPIRLLERAIELDPEFAQAHALLATAHGDLYWFGRSRNPERLTRMKAAVDRAFEIRPDLPEARLALADYYYRGFYDYERALEQLELARRSLPNDSLVQFHLGLTYRRLGEMDRSIDSFEAATRNDPANLRAHCEAVNTATASGRFERARFLAEVAERRFPSKAQVAGVRAQLALDSRGDVAGARAILDAAVAEPDNFFDSTRFLTAMAERRFREAAEIARAPDPFDAVAPGWGATEAARALSLGGLDAEAKKALEEGARVLEAELAKPYAESYGWPHLAYAINLAVRGRGAEAIASCERALRILPWEKDKVHGATFRQECAWVQAKAGRVDDALDTIDASLHHSWRLSRWFLALDPRWDFLRGNPRFRELSTPVEPKAGR